MSCVDVCPVADTLELKSLVTKKPMNKKITAYVIVLIFLVITGAAKLSGYWNNSITKEQYLELYKNMNNIGHPTDVNQMKEFDENAKQNQQQQE